MLFFISITLAFISGSLQISTKDSKSYVGGVVEYQGVVEGKDFQDVIRINTNNYLQIIKKAAEYNVDVLAFPESAIALASSFDPKDLSKFQVLISHMPDPEDEIVLCHDERYDSFLRNISCAALENRMYILINNPERVECENEVVAKCEAEGKDFIIYNTNLVFDREGRAISRYRKYNLFNEAPVTSVPPSPVPTFFDTDFGVRIGHIVCFDMMFEKPSLELMREHNVTDVIHPSHWVSSGPMTYSVEVQSAWAYENDVNLLATGGDDPMTSGGGSGIYAGRMGPLEVFLPKRASNALIVAEVPKKINGKRKMAPYPEKSITYIFNASEVARSSNFDLNNQFRAFKQDFRLFTTQLLDTSIHHQSTELCDRGLCCHFNIDISEEKNEIQDPNNYYRYRLMAFNGVMSFSGAADGGISTCGVIYCTDDTLESCSELLGDGKNVSKITKFEKLEIKMPIDRDNNNLYLPITFDQNLLPLNANEFYERRESTGTNHTLIMGLNESRENLLTFGILGRVFSRDNTEVTGPETSQLRYLFMNFLNRYNVLSNEIKLHVH